MDTEKLIQLLRSKNPKAQRIGLFAGFCFLIALVIPIWNEKDTSVGDKVQKVVTAFITTLLPVVMAASLDPASLIDTDKQTDTDTKKEE